MTRPRDTAHRWRKIGACRERSLEELSGAPNARQVHGVDLLLGEKVIAIGQGVDLVGKTRKLDAFDMARQRLGDSRGQLSIAVGCIENIEGEPITPDDGAT